MIYFESSFLFSCSSSKSSSSWSSSSVSESSTFSTTAQNRRRHDHCNHPRSARILLCLILHARHVGGCLHEPLEMRSGRMRGSQLAVCWSSRSPWEYVQNLDLCVECRSTHEGRLEAWQ